MAVSEKNGRAARISFEAFFLFLVMLLLVGASLVLFRGSSFAWFSNNRQNGVRGMQTEVSGAGITIEYYKQSPDGEGYLPLLRPEEIFSGMMPGDSVRLLVRYTSHAEADISLSVRLSVPEGGEVPLTIGGRYYYLSTQLKVVETGEFLLAPPDDLLSYGAPVAPTDTELGTVTVPAGGEAELAFSVMLVNYPDTDQSAYQGFGTGGEETCYRQILSDLR